MNKGNYIKLLLVGIVMAAAGICYAAGSIKTGGGEFVIESGTAEEKAETSEADETAADETAVSDASEKAPAAGTVVSEGREVPEKIVVHVCGEVAVPGVYELPEGSRIYQAVELAGGYTADAAEDYLNMAQVLSDGVKLEVPDKEAAAKLPEAAGAGGQSGTGRSGAVQAEVQSGSGGVSAKVNINTAAKEELMTLKGIGQARAEDIIAYRQTNGPFGKIEDIMKVSGIKEAAFQKIKENIAV